MKFGSLNNLNNLSSIGTQGSGQNPLLSSVYSYYKMSDATDSSGNGNTLTNANTTFVSGHLGNAGSFDGSTTILSRASGFAMSNTSGSVAMWFSPTAYGTDNYLIDLGSSSSDGQFLIRQELSAFNIIYRRSDNSAAVVLTPALPAAGSGWHFLVVTWDATNIIYYLDGAAGVSTALLGGGVQAFGTSMCIGGFTGRVWNGLIDDTILWNRAISSGEASALWNGGTGIIIS